MPTSTTTKRTKATKKGAVAPPSTFVLGDLHGHHRQAVGLLREAGLLDEQEHWAGKDAHLWFLGDFYDRGPDGIACQDLAMRLSAEAASAGGFCGSVLGNHDVMLLAAQRMPHVPIEPDAESFYDLWRMNGGVQRDLNGLDGQRAEWLMNLPAVVRSGDAIILHADAALYPKYGKTVERVNNAFRTLLHGNDAAAWGRLVIEFVEHAGFFERPKSAAHALKVFGGTQIIHGHTPIGKLAGCSDSQVRTAFSYNDGCCINCDGGMYRGGPGFVFQLVPMAAA